MSVIVTFVDNDSNPIILSSEVELVLLGDGKPLAIAVPNEDGKVVFEASTKGVEHLAVRVRARQEPAMIAS